MHARSDVINLLFPSFLAQLSGLQSYKSWAVTYQIILIFSQASLLLPLPQPYSVDPIVKYSEKLEVLLL